MSALSKGALVQTRALPTSLLLITLALPLACSGEVATGVTSTVVGKAVEVGKGTARGLAEGVERGRRDGESLDGARLVSSWADLEGRGEIAVVDTSAATDSGEIEVTLAFVNDGDEPLRVTGLQVVALDADGFVLTPAAPPPSLTVPPHAKDRRVLRFRGEDVARLRVWDRAMTL
jgi:hypothetical protein